METNTIERREAPLPQREQLPEITRDCLGVIDMLSGHIKQVAGRLGGDDGPSSAALLEEALNAFATARRKIADLQLSAVKHTAGPWTIDASIWPVRCVDESVDLYCAEITAPAFKGVVARIQSGDHLIQLGQDAISRDEAKANALLIAAAPDLLEALKGLLAGREVMTVMRPEVRAALDAISKAEGR